MKVYYGRLLIDYEGLDETDVFSTRTKALNAIREAIEERSYYDDAELVTCEVDGECAYTQVWSRGRGWQGTIDADFIIKDFERDTFIVNAPGYPEHGTRMIGPKKTP